MSDSLQPSGLYPARLLCPKNYPGKNTGGAGHALLQGMFLIQRLSPVLSPALVSGFFTTGTTHSSVQFSSLAQSCPTLCDPMNGSTPGLPVRHQLLEFTQTHAHWVGDAIQPSHPLSSPSPPTFSLSNPKDPP